MKFAKAAVASLSGKVPSTKENLSKAIQTMLRLQGSPTAPTTNSAHAAPTAVTEEDRLLLEQITKFGFDNSATDIPTAAGMISPTETTPLRTQGNTPVVVTAQKQGLVGKDNVLTHPGSPSVSEENSLSPANLKDPSTYEGNEDKLLATEDPDASKNLSTDTAPPTNMIHPAALTNLDDESMPPPEDDDEIPAGGHSNVEASGGNPTATTQTMTTSTETTTGITHDSSKNLVSTSTEPPTSHTVTASTDTTTGSTGTNGTVKPSENTNTVTVSTETITDRVSTTTQHPTSVTTITATAPTHTTDTTSSTNTTGTTNTTDTVTLVSGGSSPANGPVGNPTVTSTTGTTPPSELVAGGSSAANGSGGKANVNTTASTVNHQSKATTGGIVNRKSHTATTPPQTRKIGAFVGVKDTSTKQAYYRSPPGIKLHQWQRETYVEAGQRCAVYGHVEYTFGLAPALPTPRKRSAADLDETSLDILEELLDNVSDEEEIDAAIHWLKKAKKNHVHSDK